MNRQKDVGLPTNFVPYNLFDCTDSDGELSDEKVSPTPSQPGADVYSCSPSPAPEAESQNLHQSPMDFDRFLTYAGSLENCGGIFYAFRNEGNASIDFGLSVERELWNQLLQGERTNNMLKARLMSLFLEIGRFAGQDIHVSDWGDSGPIENGSFQGVFTLANCDYSLVIFVNFDAAIRLTQSNPFIQLNTQTI
jgi:hypothetical protein